MGIFGRKAERRAEASGAADVFTAPERERIDALWRLTALRRETLVCAVAAPRPALSRLRSGASRSGAANLFRAMLANGSRVGGMVFPGELIWDDDPPPRANAELVSKSR